MHDNLLGPEPTLLPERAEPQAALDGGADPADVAAEYPDFSEAWAALAERALSDGQHVTGYAYARTGYHRGLDQLRRAGWKGHGPVPWRHRPNRGFLRAVAALATAARAIGEVAEFDRCRQLLADSDPETPAAMGLESQQD
ncbi:MAG: DUF3151 family protein [Pseudonocardiaceae bacterium]|nr:DUF3151 family protein [Pseudonocardiaceae bacterium]